MSDDRFRDLQSLLPADPGLVDRLCDEFTHKFRSGEQPRLEGILGRVKASEQAQALRRLLEVELRFRQTQGETPSADDYHVRFPGLHEVVDDVFRTLSVAKDSTADPSLTETRDLDSPRTPDSAALAPGERIGRYVIREILGQGGFGSVYLAHDKELDRDVAVKVPICRMLKSSEAVNRFIEEARTVAKLKHHGIVPVYDAGRGEDGRPFVVMQYVEGESLKQQLESKGRLTSEHAARLLADIAEAVAYAHKQGLVHRDLKPANVLMDGEGKTLVADFGLAIDERDQHHRAGEIAGTLQYMAPEQVRGDAHLLDGRADIWALGVMLYELLTGRRPFVGRNVEELIEELSHREARPPRMIDETISEELERIVLKCLKKPIGDRYTTANDLARDLRNWDQPKKSSNAKLIAGIATALAILIAGVIVWRLSVHFSAPDKMSSPTVATGDADETSNLAALIAEMRGLRRDLGEANGTLDGQVRSGQSNGSESGTSDSAGSPSEPDSFESPSVDTSVSIPLPAGFPKLESQMKEAREAGDEDRENSLLLKATNELISSGHFAMAENHALRMVELAGNDPGDLPFAYGQLGLAQYRLGKFDDAISSYSRSADVYRTLYDRMMRMPESGTVIEFRSHMARLLGITLMRIGNVQKAADDYGLAQTSYEESRQILQTHNRSDELATLLLNYGGLESSNGNYESAISLLSQGLSVVRKSGDSDSEAEFLVNLGNTYSRNGSNEVALEQYQLAYDHLTPKSTYALRSALLGNWSSTLLEEGQNERARELLLDLQEIARPNDDQSQKLLEFLPALNKMHGSQ